MLGKKHGESAKILVKGKLAPNTIPILYCIEYPHNYNEEAD